MGKSTITLATALALAVLSLACATVMGGVPLPTVPPPESTVAPVAASTATPDVAPLELLLQGFGQDGPDVGVAFVVQNPNTDLALAFTDYQVAAYDEAGTVLATAEGIVRRIVPQLPTAVALTMQVEETDVVNRITVQILDGDPVPADPMTPLGSADAAYLAGDFSEAVTGVIQNPHPRVVEDVRVSAVVFDDRGEIIGAGATYMSFVPPRGATGVRVSVTTSDERVGRVALFPASPETTPEGDAPDGLVAEPLVLQRQGYGQVDREVGFGMLIENPNAGALIEDSQWRVSAYAADGRVLAADDGYLIAILPGEALGLAGTLYTVTDEVVAWVEAQLLDGDPVTSEPRQPFGAEGATYRPDDHFPKVTGAIVNPTYQTVTDLRVSALLYDKAGRIVGGGYTFLDFLPANDRAAVEVSVTSAEVPARAALYATITSLSEVR